MNNNFVKIDELILNANQIASIHDNNTKKDSCWIAMSDGSEIAVSYEKEFVLSVIKSQVNRANSDSFVSIYYDNEYDSSEVIESSWHNEFTRTERLDALKASIDSLEAYYNAVLKSGI